MADDTDTLSAALKASQAGAEAVRKARAAEAFAKGFEVGVRGALAEIQPGADLGELVPTSWASLLGVAIKGCLESGAANASQISAAATEIAEQLKQAATQPNAEDELEHVDG